MKILFGFITLGVFGAWAIADKDLKLSCEGVGPDASVAQVDAIAKCKLLASERMAKTIKIRSTSIETEKDTSYFSSVEAEQRINNLNCEILKSKCNEAGDKFTCKIECKFNLTKAEVLVDNTPANKNKKQKEDIESKSVDIVATDIKSDSMLVAFSTVPKCRSIQILGRRPRTVICKTNPIEIVLFSDDELIRFIGDKKREVELTIEDVKERGQNVQVIFN